MGKSMAGHIMQKGGYEVSVYTRTASKAADLIKNGAVWKPVEQIARESDVLFLMLGYPHDVENVVLH